MMAATEGSHDRGAGAGARGRAPSVPARGWPVALLVVAAGLTAAAGPAARADEVLRAAEAIALKERLMTEDVLAGKPVSVVMGTNYETMLDR